MSRLDVVIFGATGFTGRKAVEEAVRISKKSPFSWGVAGRSRDKLEELLVQVGKVTGEELSKTRVIVCDVRDGESLRAMTSQTQVVANCCGPYRQHGEPVIRACLDTRTHHVDVSGEPEFMESMQLKYDAAAREAGVYIVSACGFDSIPNDMGVVFMQQSFGDGVLNSVESYLKTKIPSKYLGEAIRGGVIHYGTWDSLVNSVCHWNELVSLRKQLYPTKLPTLAPKLQARPVLHRAGSHWAVPFPGADGSIVYRTQRHLAESGQQPRPAQFRAYLAMNLPAALLLMVTSVFIYMMTMWTFTRSLLLRYPRVFTLGAVTRHGPSDAVMNNTAFTFELRGEGWSTRADLEQALPPNKTVTVKVKGVNPGYGATVTALLFSALTVLRERDNMPGKGGVLTTGVAFNKTDLIKHLNENNLTFEVTSVEEKK